jgi:drug/metabolite transporter (DMT)-like permease
MSCVFLQEKLNSTKLFSLGLSIFGMALIYKFSLSTGQLLAAILTCIAGVLGSATVVLTKKLSGNYAELQIMLGYFALQVVINLPLAVLTQETMPFFANTTAWLSQILYAFSMLAANYAVIEGFKHVEGSIGSLIGLAEILFGVIFGWLFFSELISLYTLIGGAIVITAAASPSIRSKRL